MSLPLADELLLHLVTPDRRAAAQHCAGLVGSGVSLEHLVEAGLAPAMAQVGALWEAAVWSVADEHVATAVAEAALSAAAAECAPPPGKGEVVVACVEGDWHSLPSRMLAEVLVSHGWSVRFLGASHPTNLLVEHIARHRPQAVLLSCAVPMALPSLVDAVQAIHDLDVPVYVGGGALGQSPRRAERAGADGWALRAGDAPRLLADPAAPGTNGTRDTSDICSRLVQYRARQAEMPGWTQRAMGVLETAMPAVARFPPRSGTGHVPTCCTCWTRPASPCYSMTRRSSTSSAPGSPTSWPPAASPPMPYPTGCGHCAKPDHPGMTAPGSTSSSAKPWSTSPRLHQLRRRRGPACGRPRRVHTERAEDQLACRQAKQREGEHRGASIDRWTAWCGDRRRRRRRHGPRDRPRRVLRRRAQQF